MENLKFSLISEQLLIRAHKGGIKEKNYIMLALDLFLPGVIYKLCFF